MVPGMNDIEADYLLANIPLPDEGMPLRVDCLDGMVDGKVEVLGLLLL